MRTLREWLATITQFTVKHIKSSGGGASEGAIKENGPFPKYQDGSEKQTGDQYRVPAERHGR